MGVRLICACIDSDIYIYMCVCICMCVYAYVCSMHLPVGLGALRGHGQSEAPVVEQVPEDPKAPTQRLKILPFWVGPIFCLGIMIYYPKDDYIRLPGYTPSVFDNHCWYMVKDVVVPAVGFWPEPRGSRRHPAVACRYCSRSLTSSWWPFALEFMRRRGGFT